MSSSPRLNVPITPEIDQFLNDLVELGHWGTKAEYIRQLIREDYKKNRDMYPELEMKRTRKPRSQEKASA